MIELRSMVHVDRINAQEIFDFLMHPTDALYQRWWPGTHLHLHPVGEADATGSMRVHMDEFIGDRRVKMNGVVLEALPARRIVWQLEKGIRLPVWLRLELGYEDAGVTIVHTIRAGFAGIGRLLDPILRIYFSPKFERGMDEHVKAEFPKLRDMLRAEGRPPPSPADRDA
jgi:uncharacterized protein YndB with AHSA1/START domain